MGAKVSPIMSYSIPTELATAEIEIKKSRFIAYAKGIQDRAEGMIWLEQIKAQYPDARHHCWAYLIGNPNCAANAGMGDDGEPSGTAGKPILNVLNHKGVGDVMIIVVRYFGGVKLGAGGLTRAYGQAAQAVMEVLSTEQQVDMLTYMVKCDFALEKQIRHWVEALQGLIVEVEYVEQVHITLKIPLVSSDTLQQKLDAYGCQYQND